MQQTKAQLIKQEVHLLDWSLRVVQYPIGEEYVCIVKNIDPGATICRVMAKTEDQAFTQALALAKEKLLQATPALVVPQIQADADLCVIKYNDPVAGETFTVKQFLSLSPDSCARLLLTGKMEFYDSKGQSLDSGQAVKILLAAM